MGVQCEPEKSRRHIKLNIIMVICSFWSEWNIFSENNSLFIKHSIEVQTQINKMLKNNNRNLNTMHVYVEGVVCRRVDLVKNGKSLILILMNHYHSVRKPSLSQVRAFNVSLSHNCSLNASGRDGQRMNVNTDRHGDSYMPSKTNLQGLMLWPSFCFLYI